MVEIEVLDRHDDGLGKQVKLVVDAKVRKVDYTLDYGYDRPTRIWWDFVDGHGIRDVDGEYTFERLAAERTRATYRLGIESGLRLPGPIVKRAHKQTLRGSVEDLKTEAERRHAEAQAGAHAEAQAGTGDPPRSPTDPFPRSGDPPPPPGARHDEPPPEREAPAPEEQGPEPPPEPGRPPEPERTPEPDRAPEPERGAADGGSVADLPTAMLGRAVSVGRDAAEAGIGVAGAAIGAGRSAAEGAIGAGRAVAGEVKGRLRRLL